MNGAVNATLLVFASGPPIPSSVSARYCGGLSASCDDSLQSIAGAPSGAVTLEPATQDWPGTGAVFGPQTLTLATSTLTSGFFEFNAQDYIPQLRYFVVDPTDSAPLYWPLLVSSAIFTAGSTAIGTHAGEDPTVGNIAPLLRDCLLDLVPGVSFSASASATRADTVIAYDQPPNAMLDRSTSNGMGYIGPVNPGLVDVRAADAVSGQTIAHRSIWTRAGAFTFVDMVPLSTAEAP